jgi:hypothetical protein
MDFIKYKSDIWYDYRIVGEEGRSYVRRVDESDYFFGGFEFGKGMNKIEKLGYYCPHSNYLLENFGEKIVLYLESEFHYYGNFVNKNIFFDCYYPYEISFTDKPKVFIDYVPNKKYYLVNKDDIIFR